MKRKLRGIAALIVAILSIALAGMSALAGQSDVGSGSNYEVDFDFDAESETVYTINLTNTLIEIATSSNAEPATPSNATPSNATSDKQNKPVKPFKQTSGEYSGYEQEKPVEDEITIIPANITEQEPGTITAHYEHSYTANGTEPNLIIDSNGDTIILNRLTLPKTGDSIDVFYRLLILSSIPLSIILLKKVCRLVKSKL